MTGRSRTRPGIGGTSPAAADPRRGASVAMIDLCVNRIGGATAIIGFGGWRLITDPTFGVA